MKKRTKAFFTIIGIGILENLAHAWYLGVTITKQTLMSTALFTLVLYLILNQMGVINKE